MINFSCQKKDMVKIFEKLLPNYTRREITEEGVFESKVDVDIQTGKLSEAAPRSLFSSSRESAVRSIMDHRSRGGDLPQESKGEEKSWVLRMVNKVRGVFGVTKNVTPERDGSANGALMVYAGEVGTVDGALVANPKGSTEVRSHAGALKVYGGGEISEVSSKKAGNVSDEDSVVGGALNFLGPVEGEQQRIVTESMELSKQNDADAMLIKELSDKAAKLEQEAVELQNSSLIVKITNCGKSAWNCICSPVESMKSFVGVIRKNPIIAVCAVVAVVSCIGIFCTVGAAPLAALAKIAYSTVANMKFVMSVKTVLSMVVGGYVGSSIWKAVDSNFPMIKASVKTREAAEVRSQIKKLEASIDTRNRKISENQNLFSMLSHRSNITTSMIQAILSSASEAKRAIASAIR
jgi:hypothetical protein